VISEYCQFRHIALKLGYHFMYSEAYNNITQGRVGMRLGCGGIFNNHFTAE